MYNYCVYILKQWASKFSLISDSEGYADSDLTSQSGESSGIPEKSFMNQESSSEGESHEASSDSTSYDSASQALLSDEQDASECELPVCQGTNVRRKTFEAAFLALSNKHNFSKLCRTNVLKFLRTFLPEPNLPSSNYLFEKNLFEAMNIHYTKYELCINCSTTITDGKCLNRNCVQLNKKLKDHEIEICFFIPIKDQLERILQGMEYSVTGPEV